MATHVLTAEEIARGGAATERTRKLTKSWYMRTLIQIADGSVKCSSTQLAALNKFAEMRGWYGPKHKKNVVSAKNLAAEVAKTKPVMTEDIMARIAQLPSLAVKPKTGESPRLPAEA